METNKPRNSVSEERSAAVVVMVVGVAELLEIVTYGPALLGALRACNDPGLTKSVLTKTEIVPLVEAKSANAGCKTYGVE